MTAPGMKASAHSSAHSPGRAAASAQASSSAVSSGLTPAVPAIPMNLDDASTRSSILRDREGRRPLSTWLYYQMPVQNYLRGLGCREQDIEDLCHEILIKLQTYIVLNYDPARPFRPYFKAAIRNFYFNHLRANAGVTLQPEPDAEDLAPTPVEADSVASGLVDYARHVYDLFAADAGQKLAVGIRMLHAWIIDGAKQEELATAYELTDRQVRNHLAGAADALAEWMQLRINQEDLDELAGLAKTKGLSFELDVGGIRGLFSHMSKRKRVRTLLILAIIYRQNHHIARDA